MSPIVENISAIINLFVNVLRNVYIICLWIGWFITTVMVGLLKIVVALGSYLYLGVRVLVEDFICFLEDVGEFWEKLTIEATDAVSHTFDVSYGTVSLLVGKVVEAPTVIYDMGSSIKIVYYTVHFLMLVKDGVLLIGISIWDAFCLIFTALAFLNEAPYIAVVFLARIVDRTIVDILSVIGTYWFKSLSGLCLGCACYVFLKQMGIIPNLNESLHFRHLYRYVIGTFESIGFHLWRLLRNTSMVAKRISTKINNSWKELVEQFISYTPTKAALEIKLEKEKASTLCIVCMDRRRDTMILSCCHMLMCRQCALIVAVGPGGCPVCRLPIQDIISVYT